LTAIGRAARAATIAASGRSPPQHQVIAAPRTLLPDPAMPIDCIYLYPTISYDAIASRLLPAVCGHLSTEPLLLAASIGAEMVVAFGWRHERHT
jgi:hypothetical protein